MANRWRVRSHKTELLVGASPTYPMCAVWHDICHERDEARMRNKMKEKILLVDGERLVPDSFRRMLSTRFGVETACGPDEALGAIASNGPYAVVLSDFRMPGLNGVELLQKIKILNPSTVGILLSGNAEAARSMLA